jgi:hypothetical protein
VTRAGVADAVLVAVLFAVGTGVGFGVMRAFRAAGIQPAFYQGNFEPAVMMACGRGFVTTISPAAPKSLRAFLDLKQNEFNCADLPADLPLVQVTWNGTWYYLYGTTALVWKLARFSWTALDGLVAVMSGLTTALLYALFRIASGPLIASAMALLLTLSPANLTMLLSLRDYSKAPFVLAATFVLAMLILRPMTGRSVIGVAALFGGLVGFGYGFRTDVIVMVPFGIFVMLAFLPGQWRTTVRRNLGAAIVALAVFLVVALPPLRGLRTGGCQFHYSLLGLTAPLVTEAGIAPALYSFGDHLTDTYVDLKVGDYANRVLGERAPLLCSPDYDRVSGGLFRRTALTFPADLAVHAYGAVLMITRGGVEIPTLSPPPQSTSFTARLVGFVYRIANAVTTRLVWLGPLVTAAAIAVAWTISARFGLALTAFVLFLTGYPAIQFEPRHWFQLRFIPWWSAALVVGYLLSRRSDGWSRASLGRAVIGVAATGALLVASLWTTRAVQARGLTKLIRAYESTPTAPLEIARHGSLVDVDWQPDDFGTPPEHRSSDLLVATLDRDACGRLDSLPVRVRYQADNAAHDLTTTLVVDRPFAGTDPPRLFVPVFSNGDRDHSYLRFVGFEAVGGPAECFRSVSRVVDRGAQPLWIQAYLPGDWTERPLYQTFRRPRWLQ